MQIKYYTPYYIFSLSSKWKNMINQSAINQFNKVVGLFNYRTKIGSTIYRTDYNICVKSIKDKDSSGNRPIFYQSDLEVIDSITSNWSFVQPGISYYVICTLRSRNTMYNRPKCEKIVGL